MRTMSRSSIGTDHSKRFLPDGRFTYGVTNLGSPAGYSTDYVKQYAEIKTKLASMEKDLSLEQSLSSTVAPLKRLTKDTDKQLMYPETFVYDEKLRGQPVEPQTLFGDKVEVNDGNRRQAFAAWMTSPRNPRFAKNIANRLWKRIMGVGLVEPVDSLSVLPDAEHGELLDFLSQMMIRLNFDERDFLRVVLNTPLYQSEAVRESLEPGAPFALRGPQLRRLSAEQIWDSSLVLVVKDLDERKSNFTLEGILNPQYLQKLTAMTADEIIAQARIDRVEHTRRRAYSLRLAEQQKERAAAQSRGDLEEVKRLNELHAQQNKQYLSSIGASMDSSRDGTSISTEADSRWKSVPSTFIRASETPLPLPLGHFLRQFGQSDRREIDAFDRNPNTTHSLAMMNGELTSRILEKNSFLRQQIAASKTTGSDSIQLMFRAILVRSATPVELKEMTTLTSDSPTPDEDVLWALLNSPEFLFHD